jgi:hypothetical protein
MATTWTATVSITTSSGFLSGFSGTDSEVGNTAQTGSVAFPANTNAAVNANAAAFTLNFNATAVQELFFLATQNCTISTNNGTSPTNTLNLVAGIPLYWGRSPGYFAQPLNANTNAGFITCVAATILTYGVLTN